MPIKENLKIKIIGNRKPGFEVGVDLLPFYNSILGYGIIKKPDGQWAVPMETYVRDTTERGLWKRGDLFWGISQQFLDYLENHS